MAHSILQCDHVNIALHQRRTQERKDFGSEIFNFITRVDTALRKRRNSTVLTVSLLPLRTKRMVKRWKRLHAHKGAKTHNSNQLKSGPTL